MSRILTSGALAALCALGYYGVFGPAIYNGLFPAILKTSVPPKYCPGGPAPFQTRYTGIAVVDDQFGLLICFLTIVLQGPRTLDITLVSAYLGLQFFAGWVLVCLEGLRHGNRGRIVSWTGTLGFLFQRLTYTLCVPIYLIIHVFTSPISDVTVAPHDLSVDAEDLVTLPFVAATAYLLPAVLMALPSPGLLSSSFHYHWNAIWQVFPVLQTIYHYLIKRLVVAPIGLRNIKTGYIYRLVLVFAVISQSTLLALAITPSDMVPDFLKETVDQLDFARAFIPYWPSNSPVVDEKLINAAGAGLPELVKLFLQWDINCGGSAILVWAIHVYLVALPGKRFLSNVVPKVAFWTVLGGPVGAATVLLWERDVVLQNVAAKKRK